MQPRNPKPTVTRTRNGLLLTREDRNLAENLGAIVRHAVTRTSSEASCAALLGVSIRRLRQVASDARVPLVFVAALDEAAQGASR